MGRKTISQNHPWRYFDISFAFSPKSRNERSAAESGINTKSPICTLQNDTLSVNTTLPKKRGRAEKLRSKSDV